MNKLYLFIFSTLVFFSATGQARRISGRVVSEEKEPIEGAVVVMTSLPDSLYVGSTVTDSIGTFSLPSVPDKKYLISAKQIGYSTVSKEAEDGAMIELILSVETQQLKEVTVTAKPVMKQEAGKFVFMPGELTKMSRNGLDLVGLSPILNLSMGELSIIGKGAAIIHINGRPYPGGNNAAKNYLISLKPEYIKKIEVMPDGEISQSLGNNNGIVNVVVDDPRIGYRGFADYMNAYVLGETIGEGRGWVGYSGQKFKYTVTTFLSSGKAFIRSENLNHFKDGSSLNISQNNSKESFSTGAGAGLSYDFSSTRRLGMWLSISGGESNTANKAKSERINDNLMQTDFSKTLNSSPFEIAGKASVYWIQYFGNKGTNLYVTTDGLMSRPSNQTKQIVNESPTLNERSKAENNAFNAKADFKWSVADNINIRAGYQFLHTKIIDKRIDNIDSQKDNRYKYKETDNCLYIQYSHQISKAIGIRASMRYEHIMQVGKTDDKINLIEQMGFQSTFKNHHNLLCPTLDLGFTLPNHNQDITLNLSRRFFKPSYNSLNPFPKWVSENEYELGNPNQGYSDMWFTSISYSVANHWIIRLSYDFIPTSVSNCRYADSEGKIIKSERLTGSERSTNISILYFSTPSSRLFLRGSALIGRKIEKAWLDDKYLGYKNWDLDFKFSSRISIDAKRTCYAEIGINASSPFKTATRERRWSFPFTLQVSKSLNSAWEIKAELRQELNWQIDKFRSSDYSYITRTHGERFYGKLSIQYTFGKTTAKTLSERHIESEERFK